MHLSCFKGDVILTDLLLDAGAKVNEVNQYNETPLFYSVRKENIPLIRLLIERGANKNHRDSFGDTVFEHTDNIDLKLFIKNSTDHSIIN